MKLSHLARVSFKPDVEAYQREAISTIILLSLSVSARGMIGQFCRPYFIVLE